MSVGLLAWRLCVHHTSILAWLHATMPVVTTVRVQVEYELHSRIVRAASVHGSTFLTSHFVRVPESFQQLEHHESKLFDRRAPQVLIK